MKTSSKLTLLPLSGFALLIIALVSLASAQVSFAESAGYALEFDGRNDYVYLPETQSIFGPGWEDTKSVTLWVLPTRPGRDCTYAFECDLIFGDYPRWWGIYQGNLNGQDRIWLINYDQNGVRLLGISYTPGEWVHIGLVHAEGVWRAFKNGVEVGSMLSGSTVQPYNRALPTLRLGAFLKSDTFLAFQGQIDEVRLWNIARSASEIQNDMYHSLVGNEAGLKAYYRMSDGEGKFLTDDSGNGWGGELFDGDRYLEPDGHPPTWVNSTAFDGLPTPTPVTPTAELPTATPEPPTPTPEPTDTPEPPTATSEPPTSTPVTPTNTPVTPTQTAPHPSPTPLEPEDVPTQAIYLPINIVYPGQNPP
jgi:hypothetical protein